MKKPVKQLRFILICGFILIILSGGILIFVQLGAGTGILRPQKENLSISLLEWDTAFEELLYTENEFDILNKELDRLEEKALSVESWLSVIKRRRALAGIHPPSAANYRKTLDNALKAFPSSQPVIAAACANIIKNSPITGEIESRLRSWLPLLTDPDFNSLRLSVHVILGDFNSPQRASVLPDIPYSGEDRDISINMALLKILRRDYRGASADIQNLLNTMSAAALTAKIPLLRFASEYHYDFGELLKSAEFFSLLGEYTDEETAMLRQADALYLAGYTETAAAIWKILAGSENKSISSLYNLAVTSGEIKISYAYLERIVKSGFSNDSPAGQFGLIRFSRFLDETAAIALLQGYADVYPYIDLEIRKRSSQIQTIGRRLAETWLLLDRHEKNEDLYKWAAWHFCFQRNFDEAWILINRLEQMGIASSWINFYKAVLLMYDGNLDAAEDTLRQIPLKDINWPFFANLGRIMETVHSPSRALEYYELAAETGQNPKAAARIQLGIARCNAALNRPNDVLRALISAVELDPDNVTARLELDRFF